MSSPTGDTYAVKSSGPSTDPWRTPDVHCVAVTFNNDVLISRLESQFGVDGGASSWLRLYLTDRQQFVKLDDHFVRAGTLTVDEQSSAMQAGVASVWPAPAARSPWKLS